MSNRRKKAKQWVLVSLAFSALTLPFLSGCARHPSSEELTQLEQARQASDAAERKVQVKQDEKAQVELKLAAKKAELARVKGIKAATEANLASKQ